MGGSRTKKGTRRGRVQARKNTQIVDYFESAKKINDHAVELAGRREAWGPGKAKEAVTFSRGRGGGPGPGVYQAPPGFPRKQKTSSEQAIAEIKRWHSGDTSVPLSRNALTKLKRLFEIATCDEGITDHMSDSEFKFNVKMLAFLNVKSEKNCIVEMMGAHKMVCENDHEPFKLTCMWKAVELRENAMGKGVYATMDIPSDKTLTYYPAHAMCLKVPKEGDPEHCNEMWLTIDEYKEMKDRDGGKELGDYIKGPLRAYTMSTSKYSYAGDPLIVDKPWLLGHMLNDLGYDGTRIYKPYENCNCVYNGMEVSSTRDIKKGEELSVAYGSRYWFQEDNSYGAHRKSWHEIHNPDSLARQMSNEETCE